MQSFPSIKAVRKALVLANKDTPCIQHNEPYEDATIPVRLQVYESGYWTLRTGSPDYDQDHRGLWGSGYVRGDRRRCDLTELARDLIGQVRAALEEKPVLDAGDLLTKKLQAQAEAQRDAPEVRVVFPEIW
jgi:hypothetical protein